jgi:hypothetical protein
VTASGFYPSSSLWTYYTTFDLYHPLHPFRDTISLTSDHFVSSTWLGVLHACDDINVDSWPTCTILRLSSFPTLAPLHRCSPFHFSKEASLLSPTHPFLFLTFAACPKPGDRTRAKGHVSNHRRHGLSLSEWRHRILGLQAIPFRFLPFWLLGFYPTKKIEASPILTGLLDTHCWFQAVVVTMRREDSWDG